MDIKYNYSTRVFQVGGMVFALDRLEDHILKYWFPLANRYRLKPISVNGTLRYTYDWIKVFTIAQEGALIIEDFLLRQGVLKSRVREREHKVRKESRNVVAVPKPVADGFKQTNLFDEAT